MSKIETKIFKNYEDFAEYVNDNLINDVVCNGCSKDFLKEHGITINKYNKLNNTNKYCWNCWNCQYCEECEDCINCEDCNRCYRCGWCFDCEMCTDCEHCEDITVGKNISNDGYEKLNEDVLGTAAFGIDVQPISQDDEFFDNGRIGAEVFRERTSTNTTRHNTDDTLNVGDTIVYMSKTTDSKIQAKVLSVNNDYLMIKTLKTELPLKIKRDQVLDIIERDVNESMDFNKLLTKMYHGHSEKVDFEKEELKDVVIISAVRNRLIDLKDNDVILNNKKYITGVNEWNVESITNDLKKSDNVLIDKELEVVYDSKREKYVIQSVDTYTEQENEDRTEKLKSTLIKLGYGVKYVNIDGAYTYKESDENRIKLENSYFVVNLENNSDFLTDIAKLSEYFNQDCFIFKPADDKTAYYVGTNSGYVGYHNLEKVKEKVFDDVYTQFNKGFTFESLEHCICRNLSYKTTRLGKDLYTDHYNMRNELAEPVLECIEKKRKWEIDGIGIYEDYEFINEKTNFRKLMAKMHHKYSNKTNPDKRELKDVAIISACRDRLMNFKNNDDMLKDKKYIIGENKWDIDAITNDLLDQDEVLIDKDKLEVANIKIKDENGKVVDEKYVIQSVDGYTEKENVKRTQELSAALKKLRYGVKYMSTDGMFKETNSKSVRSEYSFFVVNLNNNPDFLTDMAKLSEYYNQDSFLFKAKEDEEAFYVGTNSGWPGYHEIESAGKLKVNSFKNVYYTKVNSKGGGEGNSFTFEDYKKQYMNENLNYKTSVNDNDLTTWYNSLHSNIQRWHNNQLCGRVIESIRKKRDWED